MDSFLLKVLFPKKAAFILKGKNIWLIEFPAVFKTPESSSVARGEMQEWR